MSTSAIVVGINGGEASVAALELAMKEASLRKAHVLALICWPTETRRDDSGAMRCRSHESASEILEHVVAEATIHDPHHVPIVREVSQSLDEVDIEIDLHQSPVGR